MKPMLTGVIAVITLWFLSSTASAHSLNLFVHDEGTAVKGNAYFTGGTPAQNVSIRVEDSANTLLGETKTDAEGNFVYTGPRSAGTMVFIASTPDGHRAQAGIESAANKDVAPAAPTAQSDTAVISYEAQLTKLHEAIDRLEKRLWLRDVLGGIGYIFGLAGLWALIKARNRSNGH